MLSVFWLPSLSRTSWKKKKKKENPQTWNRNGNSARRYHLLRCNSELSKGIFEEAKGLLMNRLFIDLWTKQSLIMCGWAFNWGSETRSLLAKLIHGQEGGEFDWVLCHWGEGWHTKVTQPMPLDLPFSLLHLCLFFLSASPFLCLLVIDTCCVLLLSLYFQILQSKSPHFLQLLFCHVFSLAYIFDFLPWINGSSAEVSKAIENLEEEHIDSIRCACVYVL